MRYNQGAPLFRKSRNNLLSDRLHAWLELIRLPNLLTVPGDVLSGACLSALLLNTAFKGSTLFFSVLAVFFLYVMGLLQNDLNDLSVDRFQRPNRPLPSKRVSTSTAAVALVAALFLGLFFAFLASRAVFYLAVVLSIAIWAYNLLFKKRYFAGPFCMGLCRGFSFLIGVATVSWHTGTVPVFLGIVAYIFFVTRIAESENRRQVPNARVFLPLASFFLAWLLTVPFLIYYRQQISSASLVLSALCFIMSILAVGLAALKVYNRSVGPDGMRGLISSLLRALLPWQAAWVVLFPSAWTVVAMLIILIFWPLTILLNKEFSQS